jgi:hypothetical protein
MATTKYVRVLRGSIELPLLDAEGRQVWPQTVKISEGELVDLPADLADRLSATGQVEIQPQT